MIFRRTSDQRRAGHVNTGGRDGRHLRRNGVEYLAVAPPSLAAAGASPDPFGSELAYRRFEKALAEQPFASSVIYKSEIGRLYRVPGE